MVDVDPREKRLAVQRSKLSREHRMQQALLNGFGVIDTAIAVADAGGINAGLETRTPQTRFVVSLGVVVENNKPDNETLYLTRFEGDDRVWGVEVGKRIKGGPVEHTLPFSSEHAKLVARCVDKLARLKESGELSKLNIDLDRIKD